MLMRQNFKGFQTIATVAMAAMAPLASQASAGNPVGVGALTNTVTAGAQSNAAVARVAANGRHVVVYESAGTIKGVRYLTDGVKLITGGGVATEFDVSDAIAGETYGNPDIAVDANGIFTVVYEATSAGQTDIRARRFGNDGLPLGASVVVNTFTTNNQLTPSIAMAADGSSVVVWSSSGNPGGNGTDVYMQRYDALGTAVGVETRVNSLINASQSMPDVSVSPLDGGFVVVFQSSAALAGGAGTDVHMRRFNAAGTALATDARVNVTVTSTQQTPSVSHGSTGNFNVVWASNEIAANGFDIRARRYDVMGTALDGADIAVNAAVSGNQTTPQVASDTNGFTVAWAGLDGNGAGILAKRYLNDGSVSVTDYVVNNVIAGTQNLPAIAAANNGNFTVAWTTPDADGTGVTATVGCGQTSGLIRFAANVVVSEGAGVASLVPERFDGCSGAVSADYATANGTALAGSDYTAVAGTLSFANGVISLPVVNVPILEDVVAEFSETVEVNLSNPMGGATTGPVRFVRILDNEASQVSLTPGNIATAEGGTANLRVLRRGDLSGTISVDFASADGTATAGSDYVAISGTLTLVPNASSATLSVQTIDDAVVEPNETLTVTISNPVNTTITSATATVRINNND